jgi:hypothetical protein
LIFSRPFDIQASKVPNYRRTPLITVPFNEKKKEEKKNRKGKKENPLYLVPKNAPQRMSPAPSSCKPA